MRVAGMPARERSHNCGLCDCLNSKMYELMRRLRDILAAVLLLVALSPLLIALSLAVRICIGRPVIFLQQRPGRHGKLFTLLKFRTMTIGDGDDASRLEGFGRLLRRTSLDELPELWNVLRGDMSLVGPRPLLPEYLALYNEQQARRHEVRPGMTGWAQVNGRNSLTWPERFKMDVWYVDHQSMWLDLKIIGMTCIQVFKTSEVSSQGHATTEPFRGNE